MDNNLKQQVFDNFTWIDLCNPDLDNLNSIAEQFQLDYYQITDSLERGHLPKFEKLINYNFLIFRAITSNISDGETTIDALTNKIAIFYNQEKIITIHRNPFSFLEKIEQQFDSTESLLMFLLINMIDTFNQPLQQLDEEIEEFERKVFLKGNLKVSMEQLYYLKSQARIIKKLLLIFQNVILQLEVDKKNKSALQDAKDSLVKLVLSYDELLENMISLVNSYLSVNAQRNNDVMKLLTIFSAFFLPLTFIVGVYGMNFNNMPELKMDMGYYYILAVMLLIVIVIYIWFRRKNIL